MSEDKRYSFDFKRKYMWRALLTKPGMVFAMWGIRQTLIFMVKDTLRRR